MKLEINHNASFALTIGITVISICLAMAYGCHQHEETARRAIEAEHGLLSKDTNTNETEEEN